MASTLIVRDATLAINGAPETRSEPEDFLRNRVVEVSHLDRELIEECAEVLLAESHGEETSLEILEALTILALSQPEVSSEVGVSALAHGRRLASRLEQDGEVEHALVVLELLLEYHPGHRALERDLASLMRRAGLVSDLVERYIERAQALLKEGKTNEAIAWYREVLLLDRSRKDVARTIRDLRFQEVDERKGRGRRRKIALVVLVLSTLVSLAVLREKRVRDAYQTLPAAPEGNLSEMRARLTGLEGFMKEYPVWHGSLATLSERSRLRVETDRLETEQTLERERLREEGERVLEIVHLARQRGLLHAHSGDLTSALREFENALAAAPSGWPDRERVERDVTSIRAHLQEKEQ
jgi:tetratricopeptide (TPR) repeat protein